MHHSMHAYSYHASMHVCIQASMAIHYCKHPYLYRSTEVVYSNHNHKVLSFSLQTLYLPNALSRSQTLHSHLSIVPPHANLSASLSTAFLFSSQPMLASTFGFACCCSKLRVAALLPLLTLLVAAPSFELLLWASSFLLRPSHNLSGNGRAATSRDTGVTNQDLGASHGAMRG